MIPLSNARADSPRTSSQVVISGVGLITPCGGDRESSWTGLLSGIGRARRLGEAEGFDLARCPPGWIPAGAPALFSFQPDAPDTPAEQLALEVASEAWQDARLASEPCPAERLAVVIGSSKGQLTSGFATRDFDSTDCSFPWFRSWPSGTASRVSAAWKAYGPCLAPVAACATGVISVLRGVELLQQDLVDIVIAGSVEAPLSPLVWSSYRRLGVLAPILDDPATACRPFDRDRQGFVMGTGGGMLILERLNDVRARGGTPWCEIVTGGLLTDPAGVTSVSADALSLTRLIQQVIRRADIQPDEIDYINLHGTGTRDNDYCETRGICQALGPAAQGIRCSSLKGTIGHLLGAAGSVELAATALALRDGLVPPTANWTHRDPELQLDYTPRSVRPSRLRTALKLSLGFGGHQAAILLRKL